MIDDPIRLAITVEIQQGNYPTGLRLSDNLELKPRTFVELCQILAEFDTLAKKFKESK